MRSTVGLSSPAQTQSNDNNYQYYLQMFSGYNQILTTKPCFMIFVSWKCYLYLVEAQIEVFLSVILLSVYNICMLRCQFCQFCQFPYFTTTKLSNLDSQKFGYWISLRLSNANYNKFTRISIKYLNLINLDFANSLSLKGH